MRASYSAQSFKRQASARFPNSYSVMQRKKSLARAKVAAPADPILPLISAPSPAEPAEATPPPPAPIAAAPAMVAPTPPPAIFVPTPAVVAPPVIAQPVVAATPATPAVGATPTTAAAPVPVAPPPAAPAGAPFSDAKGLMDYEMSAYKALGPQKGAQIQQVLTGLGVSTINEVKPEQYAALFAGVEALK